MASNEKKAQQLIVEAENKLSASKGFFSSLFGGSAKIEDAIECYQRAANLYKMAKNWESAGGAFCEAATLHSKIGFRHDAAVNYVDAANCYKKFDTNEAVNCLLKAIEIYTDMGRFTVAAKHHISIGELYENGIVELDRAGQHYEQAADYFRSEECHSFANKCLLKVAQFAAQLENYQKSIDIYEQVSTISLESSLLKYSVKEYLFRATLCHLCVDLLNAQHALERYSRLYPTFQDSREYKLLQTLIDHIEDENVDSFANAVKEYDSVSRLDQWYTIMLLRIKKQITERPGSIQFLYLLWLQNTSTNP
ncbi:hypothetical protein FQA39_LY01620 [Lamprigera yunnana]|nr:hypothetical protein FQA39_LY01620 [Lamprigera yunnana]